GTVKGPGGQIDQAAAESFLYRAEGRASTENKKGTYRLTEHKSHADASFELEYLAAAQPVLVHFNRIASRYLEDAALGFGWVGKWTAPPATARRARTDLSYCWPISRRYAQDLPTPPLD